MKKVGVIGSGFAGLSAAACLARAGYEVTILEKNSIPGGRARTFHKDGFVFDMGPSWYWMPEVFEQFYQTFGKTSADYYELKRLDPSYDVVFGPGDKLPLPADYQALRTVFEEMEPGSASRLDGFLRDAEYKYTVGMQEFVWKPSHSVMEFADIRVVQSLFRLQMLSSVSKQIDGLFRNEKIRNILKFPVLFLGATPENTPALYSLMNYADIKLGTWYPMGGMYKVVEAFVDIARQQGANLVTDAEVKRIEVSGRKAVAVHTDKEVYRFDAIVAAGDYHHIDQHLLPEGKRNYTASYWEKRTMAPSSLLFYVGLSRKVDGLGHHTLFFDRDFAQHAHEIYTRPSWPSEPLFYVCCPSSTDPSVAPDGKENLFFLMPLAPGIHDTDALREEYFHRMCDRFAAQTGLDIRPHIEFQQSYCVHDFVKDYHAFRGNAYGLANTLGQTAFLKPKMKNRHLDNFFYAGQLTTPGPGVPPSIISGQVVASEIISTLK